MFANRVKFHGTVCRHYFNGLSARVSGTRKESQSFWNPDRIKGGCRVEKMAKTFAWTVGAAATKISNDTGTGYEEPLEAGRPSLDGGQIITQVFEEQASEIKISSWQAGVVFFKSCFGVCTLGMPFAFRNSGIIPGVMCVILVAFITNFATKLLVWNKRHLQETRCKGIVSIPDMALTLWGAPGLAFTNTVILICQIGNCIAYFIFLSISLTAVIEDFFPSLAAEHAYSPYVVLILCWYRLLEL